MTMLKAVHLILFWYFAYFIQVTNTIEVEQETVEEPSHANAYQGDRNNFDDNGFPSAAFDYPLPARLHPKTNVQHYNSLENIHTVRKLNTYVQGAVANPLWAVS